MRKLLLFLAFFTAIAAYCSKACITNLGSNNVSVIDTTTNSVVQTINVGNRPRCIAITTSSKQPSKSVTVPLSPQALFILAGFILLADIVAGDLPNT